MKYQIVNMSGNVIKVFHGQNAKHQAEQFIHKNQALRLRIRDVSPPKGEK